MGQAVFCPAEPEKTPDEETSDEETSEEETSNEETSPFHILVRGSTNESERRLPPAGKSKEQQQSSPRLKTSAQAKVRVPVSLVCGRQCYAPSTKGCLVHYKKANIWIVFQ